LITLNFSLIAAAAAAVVVIYLFIYLFARNKRTCKQLAEQ